MLNQGMFITGTDTGVGKTHTGVQLARQLTAIGKQVVPRKPVESGCETEHGELIPKDAMALKLAAAYEGPLNEVCPYRFSQVTSPRRAAKLAGKTLTTQQLYDACLLNTEYDLMMVEGAGGFYSPLAEDGLNADLAQLLGYPVLLVAADKLGCINQVLLTAEAIRHRGLTLLAVILNTLEDRPNDELNNREELSELIDTPIFMQAYQASNRIQTLPAEFIDLLIRS